jgi:hypothetical protein
MNRTPYQERQLKRDRKNVADTIDDLGIFDGPYRQHIYDTALYNYDEFTSRRIVRARTKAVLPAVCYYDASSSVFPYKPYEFCRSHDLDYHVFMTTYKLFKTIVLPPVDIKEPDCL